MNYGIRSLGTVIYLGKSFVMKQALSQKVVLVAVSGHTEVTLSIEDFERDTILYALDEMTLYLGSKEQQAVEMSPFIAENNARKICVYGGEKLPATL